MLTSEQRAIIDSIEVTKDGVKLMMPSKLAALGQLTKLDGLDKPAKENVELSGGLTLEALVTESIKSAQSGERGTSKKTNNAAGTE